MTAHRDIPPDPSAVTVRKLASVALSLGRDVRLERERRGLSTWELADAAGLSQSVISGVENGRVASLPTYLRIAVALRLQPEFALTNARRRSVRAEDPVHSAMCEIVARQCRIAGLDVGMDEPYQHFQFAGRGDVVGWERETRALVHLECRTAFPNVQEAIGSFAAKKAYLGECLGERHGIRAWRAEAHIVVALWSAEVLHAVRLHPETFRATCPDGPELFEALWAGRPRFASLTSTLVLFDPVEGRRSDRRRWVGLDDALRDNLKPRYRDYREAITALTEAGLA